MTWQELENKYNIKIFLTDGSFRPVNEWLDDLYLLYTFEQACNIVADVIQNADDLFYNVTIHKE